MMFHDIDNRTVLSGSSELWGHVRMAARKRHRRQNGFSLLEVMLATAILASSAMVLSSLLGLGVKFGGRAEARTEALSQAQSLLAEYLAVPGEQAKAEQERTGLLHSTPPRSYRIRAMEASLPESNGASASSLPMASNSMSIGLPPREGAMKGGFGKPHSNRLVIVTVEVFETSDVEASGQQSPLIQLSQLVRIAAPSQNY